MLVNYLEQMVFVTGSGVLVRFQTEMGMVHQKTSWGKGLTITFNLLMLQI